MDFPSKDDLLIMCRYEVHKYLVYPDIACMTSNCFLKLSKTKQVNILLYAKVYKNKDICFRVNKSDIIQVHQFLYQKNLFLSFSILRNFFKFLLEPENEDLFYYIFNEDQIKHIYDIEDSIDHICISLRIATSEKIMCVISFYSKDEEFNREDYVDFFRELLTRGDLFLINFFYEKWKFTIKELNGCTLEAVESGRIEVVKFLVENGANIAFQKRDLIRSVMINNYVDIFNYIFYPSIDSIYIGNRTFIECMNKNNLEIIQFVLSKVSINQAWIDYMFWNCHKSSSEVAELLIDTGADIEKYGKDTLEKAVGVNNNNLVGYLKKLIKE